MDFNIKDTKVRLFKIQADDFLTLLLAHLIEKVMLRGLLLLQKRESIVIMYLISRMMHTTWKKIFTTFTIFACFWYTKLRLMQKPSIGNAII